MKIISIMERACQLKHPLYRQHLNPSYIPWTLIDFFSYEALPEYISHYFSVTGNCFHLVSKGKYLEHFAVVFFCTWLLSFSISLTTNSKSHVKTKLFYFLPWCSQMASSLYASGPIFPNLESWRRGLKMAFKCFFFQTNLTKIAKNQWCNSLPFPGVEKKMHWYKRKAKNIHSVHSCYTATCSLHAYYIFPLYKYCKVLETRRDYPCL